MGADPLAGNAARALSQLRGFQRQDNPNPANVQRSAAEALRTVGPQEVPGNYTTALPVGSFNYRSQTLTSGSLTGVGRCIGIRLYAQGADATCQIDGGDTITVRNGAGLDINPQGQSVAPVVTWLSGTLDVVIMGVS